MKENNGIRDFLIKDVARYKSIEKYLSDTGAKYRVRIKGSTETLYYKNHVYRYVNVSEHKDQGHHISRMVQRDIDKWLEKNGDHLPRYQDDYLEQMFNISSIEKATGIPSVAVDINDCYWDTIFMLGYITKRTWIAGKRKKSWKRGRNASIGALASPEYIKDYDKGKPVLGKRKKKYVPAKPEYQYIRNHVIGTVYRLFYGLYQQLGTNFYMFLTDCVFTDYSKLKDVEKYLRDNGYKFKHKTIEFTKVDRKIKKVSWWDPDNTKNKNKYYLYADTQVVSDGLIEGHLPAETIDNWLKIKSEQKKMIRSHKSVNK